MSESSAFILIADDERQYLEGYRRALSDEYEVETAQGGEAALEAIDETVDLLLIDRRMPDMAGDEVVQTVRDREDCDCSIVMVTGVDPDLDILELGVDDYVTKPVGRDTLQETVTEALEWTTYNETLRDFFSLSNKREVLLEENPRVRESAEMESLKAEIEDLAREGVQKNGEMLQTLIQSVPDAIVALDDEGKVDVWNRSAESLFGWSYDEIEGKDAPMFDVSDEEARERLESLRERVFAGDPVSDVELTCRTKAGQRVAVSVSAAPLFTPGNAQSGTVFVFTDISERKQREQRLDVMDRVLRHNVRNHLTPINGQLHHLATQLEGEHKATVEDVLGTAQDLLGLSEQVRNVHRTLSQDVNTRPLDAVDVVETQVQRAREEYPDADVTADLPATCPVLAGDGLETALWELLDNAVRHNDGPATVEVTLTETEDGATIAVADDGPTIPATEREALDAEQEDPLTHGSGVGLWLVKWYVERYGGNLAFGRSETGGNEVCLSLPVPEE